MQASPKIKAPITVVFDCEMGRSANNALTLALLHGFSRQTKPEAQVSAVSLTRSTLQDAAFCDAVGRFYSSVWLRDYPKRYRRYRGFPVGLDSEGAPPPSKELAAVLEKKSPDGEPLYPHEVNEIFDTADPVALIRNALTAKEDEGCAIVLAGAAKNLAALLDLNGAPELIAKKVSVLAVAMDESHVEADAAAARKVMSEWPSPIVEVEAGGPRFPADTEFEWTEHHPVADALREFGEDAGTESLAAALYTVRSEAEGFALEKTSSGQHRKLKADAAALADVYREVVTAMPAARVPSGFIKRELEREKREREQQQEQQQPES